MKPSVFDIEMNSLFNILDEERTMRQPCSRLFCIISRWNFVVSQVPLWVAPNLITMVGLAVNIGTALILFLCCPTLTEPVKAQIRIRNSCTLYEG